MRMADLQIQHNATHGRLVNRPFSSIYNNKGIVLDIQGFHPTANIF